MLDTTLKELNAKGILVGPSETEEAFTSRVQALQSLCSIDRVKDYPEALAIAQSQFGFSPDWVPLIFDNRQLASWHGAVAWLDVDAPLGIQLKRSFKKNKKLFFIYHRDQIIAHELAHIARSAFNESKYEEFLASLAFASPWRRLLGGLISTPFESFVFLATIMISFSASLLSFFSPFFFGHPSSLFICQALPLLFLTLCLLRGAYRLSIYRKTVKNLKLAGACDPPWLILRLTDREIKKFAFSTKASIHRYFKEKAHSSLRIKQILASYFPDLD